MSARSTAVYLRVSTSDQSTQSQEAEVNAYVARQGWENVTVYRDVMSGAKESRPALDQLLKDARAGKIERVVAYKLDRMGRSLTHFLSMAQEFSSLKVPMIFTSQGINTDEQNPAGKLMMQMLGCFAEFERSLIQERVKSGLARAKAAGVILGRKDRHREKYQTDVKKLRGEGMSVRKIGEQLGIHRSAVERCLKASVSVN